MTEQTKNELYDPNHWNDRYYESSQCPKCGNCEMERTKAELYVAMANHTC